MCIKDRSGGEIVTLRKAAKGVFLKRRSVIAPYNIGFNDGDETQFDVRTLSELEECWKEFCEDEKCDPNSVDYVEKA